MILDTKEGHSAWLDAISFLKTKEAVKALEWNNGLFKSARAHTSDIGPKGLEHFASSDGTNWDDRIAKYFKKANMKFGEKIVFVDDDWTDTIEAAMI